jgi:hypothetical protein
VRVQTALPRSVVSEIGEVAWMQAGLGCTRVGEGVDVAGVWSVQTSPSCSVGEREGMVTRQAGCGTVGS